MESSPRLSDLSSGILDDATSLKASSASGLATVSMPIMAPLADFVGVPADLVVTADQGASG